MSDIYYSFIKCWAYKLYNCNRCWVTLNQILTTPDTYTYAFICIYFVLPKLSPFANGRDFDTNKYNKDTHTAKESSNDSRNKAATLTTAFCFFI